MASYRNALLGIGQDRMSLASLPMSNAAKCIMQKVLELGLDLTLDVETPGDGACFFHAVIQQLSQHGLYLKLPKVRIMQW